MCNESVLERLLLVSQQNVGPFRMGFGAVRQRRADGAQEGHHLASLERFGEDVQEVVLQSLGHQWSFAKGRDQHNRRPVVIVLQPAKNLPSRQRRHL